MLEFIVQRIVKIFLCEGNHLEYVATVFEKFEKISVKEYSVNYNTIQILNLL